MTAKLPPLPNTRLRFGITVTPTGERLDYSADNMHAYALQAVRDALERAAQKCEFNTDYVSANSIRALLKEYGDE